MPQIEFTIDKFDRDAWDAATAPFADANLLQSWAYGEARAAAGGWHVERGLLTDGDGVLGAAQVAVKSLPVVGGGLAWVSRGPIWRRNGAPPDADAVGRMLGTLRRHYVSERGMYLRVAPALEQDAPGCLGFAAAGFGATGTAGWASAALDLTRETEELRAGLEQKWRNALNKAERLELEVEVGEDDQTFESFIDEYRDFLGERGFATTVTPELLISLQTHLAPGNKLICYRARHDGAPVGSVVIARGGAAAEYLAGTSLEAGRGLNAGQLLLWRAIEDMKRAGLASFDVGGLDPDLTPSGVYHFKKGLGGHPYRYAEEIEADDSGWRARLVRWRVTRARRTPSIEAGS